MLCLALVSCARTDAVDPPPALEGEAMIPPSEGEAESEPSEPAGPLELTVKEAILTALDNNRALRLERLSPKRSRVSEDSARAVFDPTLTAGYSTSRDRTDRRDTGADETSKDFGADVGVSQFLPTGTSVEAGVSTDRSWSDLYGDQHTTRADLTVTQALLRGAGLRRNLAALRQARLDTLASEYELRGFAESLVAQVEETYWNLALAERRIEIVTDSLKLAEQQLAETEERIKLGKLAEIERAAARTEVALRREGLIDARGALATTRLRLLRLVNAPGADLWGRPVALRDAPAAPEATLDDVESHVKVALRLRPDLNQARLALERQELEVVTTRNGLLPKLDLFITLGRTGYADSFASSTDDLDDGSHDLRAGVNLEIPLGNRSARASHRRALLGREGAEESLKNLAQLVQVDVRSAYIEVTRSREQVAATKVTRERQAESLRAETEKFKLGKSTAFLVAQAQRDLLAARLGEVEAVVNYLKALVGLYRLEGALLERRGLVVPGAAPAEAIRSAPR